METKTMLSPFITNHQSYRTHSNHIITIFPLVLKVEIFVLNFAFRNLQETIIQHFAPRFDK